MNLIDDFLNGITMYRLLYYCLIFLLAVAFVFSFFGVMPFAPQDLIISSILILVSCLVVNAIFEYFLKVKSNPDSIYITSFILSLIILPTVGIISIFEISLLAMSSKYILAIKKKHIFNPAGIAVVIAGLALNKPPSWWIASPYMAIFVIIIGLLITRKIRRFDLVLSFLAVFVLISRSIEAFLYTPVLFIAFVMLTEPTTTPPVKYLRIVYGAIVGALGFYFTPEISLVIGNIFSYIVSPKEKLVLKLKEKLKMTQDVFEFIFTADRKLSFSPGQYMEWTYFHKPYDNRGVRRYFTIGSSPTEEDIRIGVKFYPDSSTFKKSLLSMKNGERIFASQLSGDFTLPKDKNTKLVFIAGGIGITPFRSIVKYLIDNNEKRDIVLFVSNKTDSDIVYRDIFDKSGVKTIYVSTNTQGFITKEMIVKNVPDHMERTFYLSGPRSMIVSFKGTLKKLGIKRIRTDYFPGFV